jgi:hypothetical protein
MEPTYRQVVESTLARIEEHVYSAGCTYVINGQQHTVEPAPAWVMALAPALHESLDRYDYTRGPR